MTNQLWARGFGQPLTMFTQGDRLCEVSGSGQVLEIGPGCDTREPLPLTGLGLPAIFVLGEHMHMCVCTHVSLSLVQILTGN